jgi:hypothetical protein
MPQTLVFIIVKQSSKRRRAHGFLLDGTYTQGPEPFTSALQE